MKLIRTRRSVDKGNEMNPFCCLKWFNKVFILFFSAFLVIEFKQAQTVEELMAADID